MDATAITELSAEQDAARSNVFEMRIFSAASTMSAVSSTVITALPAPTPKAGVPLEYAAPTIAAPPVARMRSHCFISSFVFSSETMPTSCTRSAGAPIFSSAARMLSIIILLVSFALGCGATTMALRPFTALIALITGVASGLVDGESAPITPTGLAILTILRSTSSSIIPTDLSSMMSISAARVLVDIFRNLPL